MISIPGKIPIRIYPFFWLLAAFIGWMNSHTPLGTAIWIVVIVFSVLIHEFGHALTALAFGQRAHIELVGLGGVTHRHGERLPLWKEFIIVLNGPLAGFLLYLAASFAYDSFGEPPSRSLLSFAIGITVLANLWWTIINLLPIHPLDGGRLLSIFLEAIFGMPGIKISLFISSLLALVIAIAFFVYLGALLAGSIFLILAFESYRAWRGSMSMSLHDKDESLQKKLKEAEEMLRNGRQEEAKQTLQSIREMTKDGIVYQMATEYLANLLSHQGAYQEAFDLLHPIQDHLSADSLRLLHQLAYRVGAIKTAIDVGNRSYQAFPNYHTALINAFCYSLSGEVKPAVGWLQRAITDGLPNFKEVFLKTEFDPIRDSYLFQNLVGKYPGQH